MYIMQHYKISQRDLHNIVNTQQQSVEQFEIVPSGLRIHFTLLPVLLVPSQYLRSTFTVTLLAVLPKRKQQSVKRISSGTERNRTHKS